MMEALMNIRETLDAIASGYENARKEEFSKHPLAGIIRKNLPIALKTTSSFSNNLILKGSAGQGRWAEVPWCAIFNPLITKSAETGYYVVYLFDAKNDKVYLSLNQGTDSVKKQFPRNAYDFLKTKANLYRSLLVEVKNSLPLKNINNFNGQKATGYAAGHILGFEYDADNLPDEHQLISDLKMALKAYSILIFKDDSIENDTYDSVIESPLQIVERRRYHVHQKIERNSSAAQKVKQRLKTTCQCCGFNFTERYGKIGEGFIEVHHLKPISSLEPGSVESYDIEKDFAVLCANCHRMIHRMIRDKKGHAVTIDELRAQLKKII